MKAKTKKPQWIKVVSPAVLAVSLFFLVVGLVMWDSAPKSNQCKSAYELGVADAALVVSDSHPEIKYQDIVKTAKEYREKNTPKLLDNLGGGGTVSQEGK